jgi:dephospho-CoA kinase
MKNSNLKIAITGGIGSGKSTAITLIKEMGYPVVSCDEITAELYKKQTVLRKLKRLFPTAINGIIKLKADKTEISRIVFSDKAKRKELNELLMPLILKELFIRLNREKGVVFAEVPLLYETNLQDEFDQVFVITRNKTARINSVITRSNLTEQQVNERILAQFDYDNFTPTREIIIKNDGEINSLKEKIAAAVEKVKK